MVEGRWHVWALLRLTGTLAGACGGGTSTEGGEANGACPADGMCDPSCTDDPDCLTTDSGLPNARGASTVTPGAGCGVARGFVIPDGSQGTSVTYLGDRAENSVAGASVECTVMASGDGFVVEIVLQENQRAFSLNATVTPTAEGGQEGVGTVAHYDPLSGTLQSPDAGCVVTVLPAQDITAGRAWGNFDCAEVSDPANAAIACAASGSFVGENCVR